MPSSIGATRLGDVYVNTNAFIYVFEQSSPPPRIALILPTFDWADRAPLFAVSPSGVLYYSLGGPSLIGIYRSNGKVKTEILGNSSEADVVKDLVVGPHNKLYVADSTNEIVVFPLDANPSARPTVLLHLPSIDSSVPVSLAANEEQLCVAKEGYKDLNSITCYSIKRLGAPVRTIGGSKTSILHNLADIAIDRSNRVYALLNNPDEILVFAPQAQGNIPPRRIIAGPRTGLSEPIALAFDSESRIVVLNYRNPSISLYSSSAVGNIAPIGTIGGEKTELRKPQGLALFGRHITVAEESGNLLLFDERRIGNVYPNKSIKAHCKAPLGHIAVDQWGKAYLQGCDAGIRVLALSSSELDKVKSSIFFGSPYYFYSPSNAFADLNGNLYLSDRNSLIEFSSEAQGNAEPKKTWSLSPELRVDALAVTADGIAYFANSAKNSIVVSQLRLARTISANTQISGPKTQLDGPVSLAVDSVGRLYVANMRSDSIAVFPAHSVGNVKPLALIAGPDTQLRAPSGLAIGPNNQIYVSSGPLSYASYPLEPAQNGQLLVFEAGRTGNAPPVSVEEFDRTCATGSL